MKEDLKNFIANKTEEYVRDRLMRIALNEQVNRGVQVVCHAFTPYVCLNCLDTFSHHNTNMPHFCKDCTQQLIEKYSGN